MRYVLAVIAALAAAPIHAERADYGEVYLNGLTRDQPYRGGSSSELGMVCNVNGPDGYLSIRSGPGSDFKAERKLKRLAIVEFDPQQTRGRWVRVLTAYRQVTPSGISQPLADLHVTGWAHDGYLCDFIH